MTATTAIERLIVVSVLICKFNQKILMKCVNNNDMSLNEQILICNIYHS